MTERFVTALNTVSGQVGLVPEDYLTHPHFKDQLVLVDEDQKPYADELYKSKTADEFVDAKRGAKVAESGKPTSDTDSTDDKTEAS